MKRILFVTLSIVLSLPLAAQIFSADTIRECHIDSLLLDAGNGYDSYLWNTGETTSQIYVKRTAEYSVSAFSGSDETRDSLYVDLIKTSIVEEDTIICYGDSLTLSLQDIEPECLRALYPLNADGNDISGNNHHGLVIEVVPFSNRYDENAMAGFFNPSSKSRIMIPQAEDLELTNVFTLSAWINPSEGWGSGASDGEYYIINKWRTVLPGESSYILGINENGVLFFRTTDGTGTSEINATAPLLTERWYHVVVVMENGKLTMYLGDVTGIQQEASADDFVIPQESPTDIYIGAAVQTNDHNFKGGIDDVRLYSCALSDIDVETLNRVNMTYDMTFEWSDGSTDTSLRVSPREATWYYVDIDDGINHCTDSVFVDVYPEITIDVEQIGQGCPGSTIGALHAKVNGGIPFEEITPGQPRSPYTYTWSPIVFNYDSIALRLAEGDYTITIVDSVGCSVKETATVETFESPGVEAEADPESIYIQNPKITFTGTSDNALTYYWDFGDTTYSTEQNPIHLYEKLNMEITAYDVWVYVEDVNGCRDSASLTLDVREAELTIPDVFTPNADGVNDFFEVQVTGEEGKAITDIYLNSVMVIYNRWGQKVFEDNDYSGQPGNSWDGGNHDDGTYYYILRCTGFFKEDIFRGVVHILTNPPKDGN